MLPFKYTCLLAFILACVSFSCVKDFFGCVCTTEFRGYAVHIATADRQPIDSLVTRVTNTQSTIVYRSESSTSGGWYGTLGSYVVLTDAEKNYFTTVPDTVVFHASNREHAITETFTFAQDDCRCHLHKVSGPDSIIVR